MISKLLGSIRGTTAAMVRKLKAAPPLILRSPDFKPEFVFQHDLCAALHYHRNFQFRTHPKVSPIEKEKIETILFSHFDSIGSTVLDIRPFAIDLRMIKGAVAWHPTTATTLAAFAAGPDCAGIPHVTDEDFKNLMAETFDRKPIQTFYHDAWRDGYFWDNDGPKAKYFAAAHAQATDQGREQMITGVVHEMRLNRIAIDAIASQLDMVLVPTAFFGKDEYFRTVVEEHEVPFSWLDGDFTYPNATLLLFPKDNPKAIAAADALIAQGGLDVGAELKAAVADQRYVTSLNDVINYKKPSAAPGL